MPDEKTYKVSKLYGAQHIRRYLETDGLEGYVWQRRGTTTLILTTRGRVSGKPHVKALVFREIDGSYVVVASNGGSKKQPDWYLNLQHNPDVEVQVLGDRFRARARTASAKERGKLWPLMNEVWPSYAGYQTKTEREIPVVILERLR